jgi:hypothetical protein
MPTTTRRPARAQKTGTTAKFNAWIDKLVQELQAEERAKLLADMSAKNTAIVLHGIDQGTKCVENSGLFLMVSDAKGNSAYSYRNLEEPESWRGQAHMYGRWNPAYWYGFWEFVDANGAQWNCSIGKMVFDDFGSLVRVES